MFVGAKCCTIFSFTGLIFLLIIGILLDVQPLYVKGPHDPVSASKGCYTAAGIYAATLAVSLLYWILYALKQKATAFVQERNGGGKKKYTSVAN